MPPLMVRPRKLVALLTSSVPELLMALVEKVRLPPLVGLMLKLLLPVTPPVSS